MEEDISSTQNMIKDARARRNQKDKIFKCEICEFKSGSKTLMNRHKESIHKETRYQCEHCDHNATSKTNLKEHMESIHEGNQNDCNQCDYKATTKDTIKQHTESVHKENQNQSNNNIENVVENSVTKNRKSNHKYVPKRIQCPECEKKFNKKETFMNHKQKYHKEAITEIEDGLPKRYTKQ